MKVSKLTTIQMDQESESLLVEALKERLQMTYEERIESHENARILMEELKAAGEELRAKSQKSS